MPELSAEKDPLSWWKQIGAHNLSYRSLPEANFALLRQAVLLRDHLTKEQIKMP